MTEKDRENITLFRYGLIAPILNGQVSSQKDYLAEICSKVHQVPYYGPKEFAPKTLYCWILDYRREGFDGLKPKSALTVVSQENLAKNLRSICWL